MTHHPLDRRLTIAASPAPSRLGRFLVVLMTSIGTLLASTDRSLAQRPPVCEKANRLERFQAKHSAMGVSFQIDCYAANQETAEKAIKAAFERVDQIDQRLSNYRSNSEISRLKKNTKAGQRIPISEDLAFVLKKSREIHRDSDGAFDVTLASLTRLWRLARKRGRLPKADAIDEARKRCGMEHFVLSDDFRKIEFPSVVVPFDFGGIAKGYAADEAMRVIKQFGIASAMVDASGDIVVSQPPPGKVGWSVAIDAFPTNTRSNPAETTIVKLSNKAVATSGSSRQFLKVDGVRYSHILDPKTGIGVVHQCQVTVIARSGWEADAMASAISVLGPKQGMELANRRDQVESLILVQNDEEIRRLYSAGFPRR